MTHSLLDRQKELPRSIQLFRYAPNRVRFSWRDWDPRAVRCAEDLPQYLILGDLDPSTFQQSAIGWSARWQGTEDDTHFDVAYKADPGRWEIRQTWCSLDGGLSVFPTRMPLDKVIAQALYMQFPRSWDSAAKSQIESEYQIDRRSCRRRSWSRRWSPPGRAARSARARARHRRIRRPARPLRPSEQ